MYTVRTRGSGRRHAADSAERGVHGRYGDDICDQSPYGLAVLLQGSGVTANCFHPGVIDTKLLRRHGEEPVSAGRVAYDIFGSSRGNGKMFRKRSDHGVGRGIVLDRGA